MTAFITSNPKRFNWQMIVVASLAFWLSSSILLDFIIMPSMFFTGMMEEPSFPTAGYSLFSLYNRIELLCAAVILTGAVTLRITQAAKFGGRQGAMLALALLSIALTYTYALTPQMSALGLPLSIDSVSPPALMNGMHLGYWALETLKLAACGALIKFCLRQNAS
jgi:uncharacterized membrane protein HdeD (DUF308 family)